jgi:hypothetical protein
MGARSLKALNNFRQNFSQKSFSVKKPTSTTKLYHYQIYIPSSLKVHYGTLTNLKYSDHAKIAALDDRYGTMILPNSVNTDTAQVIEVETENGIVVKILYRVKYSDTLDMCAAIKVREGFVKTVWFNKANDLHKTLDRSKYQRKPK